MKMATVMFALMVALSVAPARADRIVATIPGATFSVPGTIGTFNYSLPAGSVILQVGLGSPLYSFTASSATFDLCFESDPAFGVCVSLLPSETQFFLGSILLTYPDTVDFPLARPLTLTVRCQAGPCPTTYTRVGGDADWALGIDFLPPPAPPTIAKAFGAALLELNGSTSLSFTLTNPNASALSGVGFSDSLPEGLVVSTPNALVGNCGAGTITATAASGSISLAGATLASSTSCTFSVSVIGTTTGTKSNTTSAVTSVEGGTGGTAFANLVVVSVPVASTNIPTLQQWALWLLGLVLLLAGIALRSRREG